MTLKETAAVMDVLTTAYPKFGRSQTEAEMLNAAKLWASMFYEDDVSIVLAAVKALVSTKEDDWPPPIGAVKARIRQLTQPQGVTEGEAWSLVREAIKNSGYNSREEFERLPPLLRRLVGGPSQLKDWSQMDGDTVQSVVASNFQRSYRAAEKSEREFAMLPEDVKQVALSFSKAMSFPDEPEQKTLHQLRQELGAHDG